MKKKVMLLFAACMVLNGCASNEVKINSQEQETVSQEKKEENYDTESNVGDNLNTLDSVEEPVKTTKKDIYETAGIDDSEAFEEMYKTIQKLAADNDKEQLADYMVYPLRVNGNGWKIKDKDSFIKYYKRIITSKIREAIINNEPEDFMSHYVWGIGIESGSVWFRSDGVYSINNEIEEILDQDEIIRSNPPENLELNWESPSEMKKSALKVLEYYNIDFNIPLENISVNETSINQQYGKLRPNRPKNLDIFYLVKGGEWTYMIGKDDVSLICKYKKPRILYQFTHKEDERWRCLTYIKDESSSQSKSDGE